MKNIKITLKDLRKLIAENAFKILEDKEEELSDVTPELNKDIDSSETLNIADETPADTDSQDSLNSSYENLSDIIKKVASSLDSTKLNQLNAEILKSLTTGKVNRNFTFDKMVSESKNRKDFDYFTTVLATLYKNANSSEKENIRKVLFLALPVYNMASIESGQGDIRPSSFAKTVAQKAGIGYDFNINAKTIDASYYIDIVADAVYEAIDYFLKNYDPDRGGLFSAQVLYKAANLAKDSLGSKLHQKTFAVGGQKYSLDEPLGDAGEEDTETKMDRVTGKEGEVTGAEREAIKGFANSLKSFVQGKLGQKDSLKNYLEFFNLFIQGHNLSEIADIMEKSSGNIRIIKMRMEDFITKFVESGELQDYVYDKTGIKIDFPNNKFTLSVQGNGKGAGEVEPVEYFQVTGHNPETGEAVGEWVQITPDKHDSETTWFNNYGDLVFGREEEAQETIETSDEEKEQQIAESLLKIIKTRLLKNSKND